MTKGALYANFENKEEIAAAVFEYNIKRVVDKEKDILRLKESPHEKLMLILDFYENAFRYEEFKYGCPVANMAPEVDDISDVLSQAVQRVIREAEGFYRQMIEQTVSLGEYPEDVDPDFASTFLSVLEGGLLNRPGHGQ